MLSPWVEGFLHIFHAYACSYICIETQTLYISGRTHTKHHTQVGRHTFKHEHNVSLVQQHRAQSLFFSRQPIRSQYGLNGSTTPQLADSNISPLCPRRWKERKRQIFITWERISHLLHSDGVFQYWNLGRGTSEEALFTGIKCSFEWKSECVCVCVYGHAAFLCVFRWKEWTGMNSCCIWVRAIIKQWKKE